MSRFQNPALNAFLADLAEELNVGLVLAQVLIRRTTTGSVAGFELRHVADQTLAAEALRRVAIAGGEVRRLAQFTAAGEFRPLKSAPTLVAGWRVVARNTAELELALNQLYPGALADWYAARQPVVPVTHYRTFTARQSGMYAGTAALGDAAVAAIIANTCAPVACLKQRLWTNAGVPPDAAGIAAGKSRIPCLEPCALLLDAARRAVPSDPAPTLVMVSGLESAD